MTTGSSGMSDHTSLVLHHPAVSPTSSSVILLSRICFPSQLRKKTILAPMLSNLNLHSTIIEFVATNIVSSVDTGVLQAATSLR